MEYLTRLLRCYGRVCPGASTATPCVSGSHPLGHQALPPVKSPLKIPTSHVIQKINTSGASDIQPAGLNINDSSLHGSCCSLTPKTTKDRSQHCLTVWHLQYDIPGPSIHWSSLKSWSFSHSKPHDSEWQCMRLPYINMVANINTEHKMLPRKMWLAEKGIAYKKVGNLAFPSLSSLSERKWESRQSMNNILSRSKGWLSTCTSKSPTLRNLTVWDLSISRTRSYNRERATQHPHIVHKHTTHPPSRNWCVHHKSKHLKD